MDGRPDSAAAAAAIISYRSTRETDDFRNALNPWTRDAPLSRAESLLDGESESVRAAALSNKHTRRSLGGN